MNDPYLKGNKEANRPHYYCFKEEGTVFLIQDMFPITDEYIERTYTIANNHLTVTSEHSALEIEKKAKKVMSMLKKEIKFTPTQPDINKIMILQKRMVMNCISYMQMKEYQENK